MLSEAGSASHVDKKDDLLNNALTDQSARTKSNSKGPELDSQRPAGALESLTFHTLETGGLVSASYLKSETYQNERTISLGKNSGQSDGSPRQLKGTKSDMSKKNLVACLVLSFFLLIPASILASGTGSAVATQSTEVLSNSPVGNLCGVTDSIFLSDIETLLFGSDASSAASACSECDAHGSCYACCICAGDTPQSCRNTCTGNDGPPKE